jgi:hypothetical protein
MTLKSALQDVKDTTLSAISGLLGKLCYLASLRQTHGRYEHWGMESVHGREGTERALRSAHFDVLAGVLRTPLASLETDLEQSASHSTTSGVEYVQEMRDHFDDLLPSGRQQSPAGSHLSSVLLALLKLEKNRERATRSVS